MYMQFSRLALAMGAALLAPLLNAGPVTFTFSSSGGSVSGSGLTTTRTYSDSSSGLSVTIYGVSIVSNNTFSQASVGYYSGNGLGVCNSAEISSCGSPYHTADNVGQYDFLLFIFNQQVDLTSISMKLFNTGGTTYDWDNSYEVSNKTFSQVNGKLASTVTFTNNDQTAFSAASNPTVTQTLSGTGTTLLFGPRYNTTDNDDFFKISTLKVNTLERLNPVPEPATYGMVGLALLGAGLLRRAKRS
jgi:hypothetical protein